MHAVINVIFADSQIEKTINYVTYEMENFLFDIGGLLGLFLGSSIVSILTMLINICKLIKIKCYKLMKRSQSEINENSVNLESSIEVQQVEMFETVLEIPFEEIISICSADMARNGTSNDI